MVRKVVRKQLNFGRISEQNGSFMRHLSSQKLDGTMTEERRNDDGMMTERIRNDFGKNFGTNLKKVTQKL